MSGTPGANRREFLAGKAAAEALAAQAKRSDPNADASAATNGTGEGTTEETYLFQVSRRAMACDFALFLNADRAVGIPDETLESLEYLDVLEDQMSVYRAHSEVSQINRLAGREPVMVERRLFGLLQQALAISEATHGAFDITSSPLSRAWGFWRREGRMPTADELETALAAVGWRNVELDPNASTIRFLRSDVEINLNAIGKGHALDRCAERIMNGEADDSVEPSETTRSDSGNVRNFVIHGGQSSILARGSRGGFDGWWVALRNPLRPEQRLIEFCLRDQALGTSGSGTQFFYHGGKRYGHVIDPRSGRPADCVLSATVLAPTAAEADALATAFYVLGAEASGAYCASHPSIAALLIVPGAREGGVEVLPLNLQESQWRRVDR
ncbi:MAG: Thiamine biosynthesis lipoprotein ApbE precursor [Planctomycetota bacterium]